MSTAENNVLSMGVGEIYKEINEFLRDLSYKSVNTSNAYKKGIERFFTIVKDKPLHFLTIEDVQINFKDLQYFVAQLKEYTDEKGNQLGNKTINHHLTAIAELIRYLHEVEIIDDIRCVSSLKRLRQPEQDNEHGVLEVHELFDLLDWIEEYEKEKVLEKFMFVVISADTMLRKSAVLNLKWNDFEVRDDHVIIRAIDKGNKDFRKLISHETYEKLLKLKEDGSDKVFNLSSSTLQVMLNRFKKHFNIPDSRRIVIHSIRKCAAEELFSETSGDIMAVRDALGHTHVNTSQKYLNKDKSSVMGMFSRGLDYDKELYKNEKISYEMLIEAIDELSDREKLLLNKKIEKLLSEKSD